MSLDGIFRTAKHVLDCQILIYKFEEIMYSFSYFLQEDQAVSEDKKLWGKRCPHSDLRRNHSLLHDGLV